MLCITVDASSGFQFKANLAERQKSYRLSYQNNHICPYSSLQNKGTSTFSNPFCFCTGVQAKGLFEFKKYTLQHFNDARRLLATGSLRTLADIVNELAVKLTIPIKVQNIGPASNMYKLKWSPKLEHKAYLYGKKHASLVPKPTLESFNYEGLVGFQWPGLLTEVIEFLLGEILPHEKIKDAIMAFVNLLESLLMALLIAWNYPLHPPVTADQNLGASEILFAHRYEIGCYSKVTFSICFMEPSRNGGWLFEEGVPCSNCPTHCEFFEDENGFIEEGDLCVPPKEESNITAALVVKQEQYVAKASMIPNIPMIIMTFVVISIYLK
ncbi:hypothetical protein CAEBREN_12214 [Caenorhabditis brenneri]|uniref:Uncharacterized protein n=1 Tax=Caenorhabditis brenneri TaxID=135651 RepID=G0MQD1_CAEBE|nr:hypothetical protein CAEBREN_12214 [Caenorhabditis brenneri]